MNQKQQRTLDSFRRVQAFLDAHQDTVGTLKTSAGRKKLDDAVAEIAAHENVQGSADLNMAGQANRARVLMDDLRARHMRPITVFARARLRGVPDFAALTRSTAGLQPKPLIRSARAMATAALPYANLFQEGGLPGDTVQQLSDAATAVEGALTGRANTKVGRVKATNGLVEEIKKGIEGVGMLDAAITKQFADDNTFLAAWVAARRVMLKTGSDRTATSSLLKLAAAAKAQVTQPKETSASPVSPSPTTPLSVADAPSSPPPTESKAIPPSTPIEAHTLHA